MDGSEIINQIVVELTGGNGQLPDALTKTKILAVKLNNRTLEKFAHTELLGYNITDAIPAYRKNTYADIVLNGSCGSINYENVKLQKKPDNRFLLENELKTDLLIGVFEIHRLIVCQDDFFDSYIASPKTVDMVEHLFRRQISPNLKITSISLAVTQASLQNTYNQIRINLLKKILRTSKKYGLQINLDDSQLKTQIMNNTINNYGDGAINNTGKIENITQTNTVNKNDIDALKKVLENLKVSKGDIAELLSVINTDSHNFNNKTFGEKTSDWIGKMIAKAANGSWQIAIGAAGSVLADTIGQFVGFK